MRLSSLVPPFGAVVLLSLALTSISGCSEPTYRVTLSSLIPENASPNELWLVNNEGEAFEADKGADAWTVEAGEYTRSELMTKLAFGLYYDSPPSRPDEGAVLCDPDDHLWTGEEIAEIFKKDTCATDVDSDAGARFTMGLAEP